MNVQNAKNLTIEEGDVKTIHDKDNRLLWGAVGYNTKYAGDTVQDGIPTPDTPIPVQTVTGEQTVEVHGKNLLNVPDGTTSRNNITLDVSDGVLRVHNTGTTTYVAFGIDNNLRHANYAPYVPWNNMTLSAGTYTISTTYVSGSTDTTGASSDFLSLRVCSRAVGDTGLFNEIEASVEINNTNGSATFTLSESKEIIIVVYEYASNKTIDISFKAQLEKGSTPTTYEPYIGTIKTVDLDTLELCKIGNYQDYIYKSGDDWYVHKETGKVVFVGTEDWQYVGGDHARFTLNKSDIALGGGAGSTPVIISDYFISTDVNTMYGGLNNSIASHNSIHQIWIKYDAITSVADFNTWLSTHNATVYYALATPTNTKITDSDLIASLNSIHEWMTRYGYEATVSGNLPLVILQTTLS